MTRSKESGAISLLHPPDFSKSETSKSRDSGHLVDSADRNFFPLFPGTGRGNTLFSQSLKNGKTSKAQKKAEEIITEARQKADEIAEKAYEKGYTEGEKAGFEYGMKKVEGMIQAFSEAKQRLEDIHKDIVLSQEKEIISLILFIAKKVIHTETRINADVLSSVLRAALEEVPHKEDLHLRLNPMDHEFLKENLQGFVESHEALKEAVIEPDPRVCLGGVVVDHKMGSVDARLSRQYEKIEKLFRKILDENQKERAQERREIQSKP